MRRRATPATPLTERHLCDRLRAVSQQLGWKAYPEVSGWDLLLVLESGEQVGVQAKLRATLEVLAQAARPRERAPGPDIRLVLIPSFPTWNGRRDFLDVAQAARLAVTTALDLNAGAAPFLETLRDAPRWNRTASLWLPPLTDLPAGVPAPRTISKWRCEAAKLCVELRAGGTITARDFAARGLGSMTSWRSALARIPGTRPARYGVTDPAKLPDVKFPHVHVALGLPAPA